MYIVRVFDILVTHDEMGNIGKRAYLGKGKWNAEITTMDVRFSKEKAEEQGYKFCHYDYYMGYDVYKKIVGLDIFTGIDILMVICVNQTTFKDAIVHLDMTEWIWKTISNHLLKTGEIYLPRNIIDTIVNKYTEERILELEKEQGRKGKIHGLLNHCIFVDDK